MHILTLFKKKENKVVESCFSDQLIIPKRWMNKESLYITH